MEKEPIINLQLAKFKKSLSGDSVIRDSLECLHDTMFAFVHYLESKVMDKKIKKVKKSMDKKLNELVKEDVPRDKKLKACDKAMKGKKK